MIPELAPRQITMWKEMWNAFLGIFTGGFPAIGVAFIVFIESICGLLFDMPVTPRGEALDLTGYELVFEDNFDGDSLDLSKWYYRTKGKVRCGYMNYETAEVKDGKLHLDLKYETINGLEGWHSSMIASHQLFTRGYFEISAICDGGNSFWSAFWLNCPEMSTDGNTNGGINGAEIDIMESWTNNNAGYAGKLIASAVHVDGYGDQLQSALVGKFKVETCATDYNTYGLKWTEDEYIFYINGVESGRSTFADGVSTVPEYIILSMELCHQTAATKDFTADFIIDYARVYQLPEDIAA